MTTTEGERKFHRKIAAQSFNKTWDLLEQKRRSRSDNETMLHLAHASRYHWGLVGTPRNQAVGDWQISRVYAALGQHDLSLQFAESSLEIAKKNRLSEILPTAYEAIARAHTVAGNRKEARTNLDKALNLLGSPNIDEEDRKIYMAQIRDTEKMLRK